MMASGTPAVRAALLAMTWSTLAQVKFSAAVSFSGKPRNSGDCGRAPRGATVLIGRHRRQL